jgi:hypothetical protein
MINNRIRPKQIVQWIQMFPFKHFFSL